MFDPTQQIERMSQVSYSVSPGTATAISLSVDHVSMSTFEENTFLFIT
jgi:hypothetical protein